ncbi:MAG: DapH/DapD/GlmU-related protein [Pedobacter sp.]|uniref:acyltransferase n=1 Tax=Pedobacter sp. TaxID=1411316 RepID=UPI0028096BD1|nr:DapH/DapD/GlmU-related protein [Pedobacter sp.]MDQ8003186.1 DapH/DapD/GlmU-related protein [Pedobacter sp.]
MNVSSNKVLLKRKLDFMLFGWIVNLAYPQYYRQKYTYLSYYYIFINYVIPQKILRINGKVPWPVHYTSRVGNYKNITKGILCDPGDNIGVYIQAINPIVIGNNVSIAAGTSIISANHNHLYHSLHDSAPPIVIGDNVFIGANSVVLPGVKIGDNVVIGAGSVIPKDIPSNCIAVGNPCKPIKPMEDYKEKYDISGFNRKILKKNLDYFK